MRAATIVLLSILLGLISGSASSESPTGPEARNERYAVRVLETSGYNDFRSRFEIQDLESKTKRVLQFTMRAVGYDEILMRPRVSWAVAVGKLPRGGYSLAIIDLATARHLDTIWCYDYSLSPTGHWLLYDSHFPKMGLPANRRSILILYDLTRDAAGNRPPDVTEFSHENAGIPVFPRANRDKGSYDVTLDQQHLFLGPKLWLPDETGVVFLEFRVKDKENFLVRLDLGRERVEREEESRIPLEPLVDGSKMSEERRDRIERQGFALFPRTLEWVVPGRTLRLVPWQEPWLQKEILLTVPQSP